MSGFYRQTADFDATCGPPCYWEGTTEAIEDFERLSVTWTCPECGHEWEELKSDQDH